MSNPDFDALKAKWYKKLKRSGFDDIEAENGSLKRWDSQAFYDRYDPTSAALKTEYYRLAGQFIYDYNFETALEKRIWTLHADGLPYPAISKAIRKTYKHVVGTGRDAVNKTVVKLRTIMYKLYEVNYEQV